jgi:CheY-like chemotaxis protein
MSGNTKTNNGSSPDTGRTAAFMEKRAHILVVEDDGRRIEWFMDRLKGRCVLDVFEKAEDGIRAVRDNKYDMIFLDHDLGGRIFVPSEDPETGYQVAKILPETVNRDTPVIVHSYNPDGADNIVSAIGRSARKEPFGSFEIAFSESGQPIVFAA